MHVRARQMSPRSNFSPFFSSFSAFCFSCFWAFQWETIIIFPKKTFSKIFSKLFYNCYCDVSDTKRWHHWYGMLPHHGYSPQLFASGSRTCFQGTNVADCLHLWSVSYSKHYLLILFNCFPMPPKYYLSLLTFTYLTLAYLTFTFNCFPKASQLLLILMYLYLTYLTFTF